MLLGRYNVCPTWQQNTVRILSIEILLRHFTKTYALNLVTLRKWPIAVVEHPFTAIMQKCVEQVNMHVTPVLHICT